MKSLGRRRERSAPPLVPQQELLGVFNVVDSPPGSEHLNREVGRIYTPTSQSAGTEEITLDQINDGPPYTSGGDFVNIKTIVPRTEVQGQGVYRGQVFGMGTIEYTGAFAAPFDTHDDFPDSFYTNLQGIMDNVDLFPDLASYGPEAWARLRPRLSTAGIGVAIAESRDLPRMLQTSAKGFHEAWIAARGNIAGLDSGRLFATPYMTPKNAADHYINHQFGWSPFIRDMHQLSDSYDDSARYMAQVKRDNGTWVKRRRIISHIESEETVFDTGWAGEFGFHVTPSDSLVTSLYTSARYRVLLRQMTDVWAAGAFLYYRPEFDMKHPASAGAMGEIKRQLTQYGARINPSIVWKATPWSWLVDWFSSVGTSIDNATAIANDSLLAKYMYLMHRTHRTLVLEQSVNFNAGPKVFEWQREVDIKRRQGALSPFGLGLTWGDLSPVQLSILGALGLSRQRPR